MKSEETIDFFLKKAWQSVANKYNKVAAEYGITQSIGYVLIHIHEGGTAVSEIASLLGVKSTSLSRILSTMEKLKMVYRETDVVDKRCVKIFLTVSGKEKRLIAKKVVRNFNDHLNDNINEEERVQLIEILKKVNQLTIAYK
jgi:DNA-binding MarR family transcriptional regulator